MKTVLVDTCVWYAIFDPRDRPNERESVKALAEQIQSMNAVIPWPITYETFCSRFAKNRLALERFEQLLKSDKKCFIDDSAYRQAALEYAFDSSLRGNRPLSLTDCLLREVLGSLDTRIDFLATYNVRDFSDVCHSQRIQILPEFR